MNFTERLAKDVARAARMTLPELEEALENGESRTVSQLTALSLAKKAAEGGMDALKMIRELSRWESEKKSEKVSDKKPQEEMPLVEIRVIGPEEDSDGA